MRVKQQQVMFVAMLAFLIAFALGCSQQSPASAPAEDSSSAPTAAPIQDETADTNDSGAISGTLEIQYFVGGYGDAFWKDAIESFKAKYPDVEVIEQAGPNVNETMRPRWIAGDPPDVVYIDGAGSSETQMVLDDQLMDLTDWLGTLTLEDGTPLQSAFLVPPSVFNGKIYALPLLFDTRGIWFDAAWFEQNDFDVPTDYESWMASMEEIKNVAGVPPIATTGVYPSVFMKGVLYPAFAAEGGLELLTALIDGEEGAWSSDGALNVMKKIEAMQEAGYIDPAFAALTHTEAQMNFLQHQHAYVPTGFWLPREMAGSIPSDFVFGIIPTPMNSADSKMAVIPDVHPVAIAKDAKNPDAAKAFVAHIMTKESAVKFAELTGAMMNITGVDLQSNPNVPEYLKMAGTLMTDESKVDLIPIPYPMSTDLQTPIGDVLVALMLGDITAEEFAQQAEEAARIFRENQ